MEQIIYFIIFITLLALGYGFGRWAEKSHYKSIFEREEKYHQLMVFSGRFPPQNTLGQNVKLVSGNVVISVDYFKRFIASLRVFVGGRITSYETLLDRARREAILRMKEEAQQLGASSIFNVKIETASISNGVKNTIGSIEVYAYGTAIY